MTRQLLNDHDPTKQATADPVRDQQQGRRHRGHRPQPGSHLPDDQEGRRRPGSRWSCSTPGVSNWQQCGGMSYFGQDESIAGRRGGQAARVRGRQEGAVRPAGAGPGPARGPVRRGEAGPRLGGNDGKALRERHRQLRRSCPRIAAKLNQDKSIDYVITLGAPIALIALQSIGQANSTRQAGHLRHQPAPIAKIKSGAGASGPWTSSRSCRATSPSTRCGCSRSTATSSAVARRC